MIVVKMMGNIGNQLFIYAFARQLQELYDNEEIVFDLSALKRYYYTADYKLDSFNLPSNISYDIKKIGRIHRFKFWISSKVFHVEQYFFQKISKRTLVPKFVTKTWLRRGCIYYFDRLHFDFPKIKRKYKYVYGYFQSDKYFYDLRESLLSEISLKRSFDDNEKSLIKKLQEPNAVGISIRANKTPENPKVKDNVWAGFITKDYYYEGMKKMNSLISNPKFYVFADDLEIVKKEYKFPYPVEYVVPKDSPTGEILLSKCQNFIITNSTFAWWGAYLSQNANKHVIMPTPWDRTGVYRDCIYFEKITKLECVFED